MTEHITDDPLHGFRPCVGIFLFKDDGSVFVGNRSNTSGDAWQFPQGGIDKGEDPEAAAFREMKEEVGTDKADIAAVSRYWRSYELPAEIASRMWGGRYKGQCQKWIALRFKGTDGDFDLASHHREFEEWMWTSPENAIHLAIPFKRSIYISVVDEFRHLWA
jgi:putative (di)nucleoside polyphosphate hydrolase